MHCCAAQHVEKRHLEISSTNRGGVEDNIAELGIFKKFESKRKQLKHQIVCVNKQPVFRPETDFLGLLYLSLSVMVQLNISESR